MAEEAGTPQHSVMCLRLMQVFRRVSRGMRRWQDGAAPPATAPLSPRHVAALEQLLGGPVTVSELASRLGLTLTTVSGVLADLDRAGFIERHPDRGMAGRCRQAPGPRPRQALARRAGGLPEGHGPARKRATHSGHHILT